MQKPKPTVADFFRKLCTPRWHNPFFWIASILLIITECIIAMIAAVYVTFITTVDFLHEQWKDAQDKIYCWRTEEYVDYRTYLDNVAESIKGEGDLNAVKKTLSYAKRYGLQTEVMTYAINAMKENPKLSLPEALVIGLEEWDI